MRSVTDWVSTRTAPLSPLPWSTLGWVPDPGSSPRWFSEASTDLRISNSLAHSHTGHARLAPGICGMVGRGSQGFRAWRHIRSFQAMPLRRPALPVNFSSFEQVSHLHFWTLCLIRTSLPISFGRRVVCLAMRVDGSDICQDDWSWAVTAHWTWQGSQNEGWMPSRSNDAAMARQWALYLRPDFRPSNALRT